jgi:hypothetical protein
LLAICVVGMVFNALAEVFVADKVRERVHVAGDIGSSAI